MIQSMTSFASGRGEAEGHDYALDIRSVNGRGLDLRLRVPDWIDGLEAGIRQRLSTRLGRGNVTLTLKVQRGSGDAAGGLSEDRIAEVLLGIARVAAQADRAGVTLAPPTALDVMLRAAAGGDTADDGTVARLRDALLAAVDQALADFLAMRADEGRALHAILSGQLDAIETLVAGAADAAEARAARTAETLRENVARLLDAAPVDEARLAQELAMLAVKADVTEEIDRLTAHVAAARALVDGDGPAGRKLDFLVQEFNREANTLCAKAQSTDLTAIGLELKAVIDQMKEQAANVE